MAPLILESQQARDNEGGLHESIKSEQSPKIPLESANDYMRQKINDQVQLTDARSVVAAPPADYPVVDLGPFMNPETSLAEAKVAVIRQVLQYAVDGGSFNVVGHGVTESLLQSLDESAGRFFDLPLDQKQAYVNPTGQNRGGFVAYGEETVSAVYGRDKEGRDLREIYSAVFPEVSSMNVPAPSEFQEAIHEYLIQMRRLDSVLFEVLTEALNMAKDLSLPSDYLECARGGATGLLRCSRYPNSSAAPTKLGAHSDWGLFTIIHSQYAGLEEIRNGQWVPVPIRSGELHVALGETLHLWSNELFVNNIHRVAMSESSAMNRSSYAYFCADGEFGNPTTDGIGPICSENETPLFQGTINAAQHAENNARVLYDKRVEI